MEPPLTHQLIWIVFFTWLQVKVQEQINWRTADKAELLQLNHTQFPSLGFFVSKKVRNQKN